MLFCESYVIRNLVKDNNLSLEKIRPILHEQTCRVVSCAAECKRNMFSIIKEDIFPTTPEIAVEVDNFAKKTLFFRWFSFCEKIT